MTAASRREELEAAIWRTVTEARTCQSPGLCTCCTARVDESMTAADAYAEAVADERAAARVTERTAGRERLAEAAAEKYRSQP